VPGHLDMLRQDYDNRCSYNQIAETLKSNNYEFDEKGNIWTDED